MHKMHRPDPLQFRRTTLAAPYKKSQLRVRMRSNANRSRSTCWVFGISYGSRRDAQSVPSCAPRLLLNSVVDHNFWSPNRMTLIIYPYDHMVTGPYVHMPRVLGNSYSSKGRPERPLLSPLWLSAGPLERTPPRPQPVSLLRPSLCLSRQAFGSDWA